MGDVSYHLCPKCQIETVGNNICPDCELEMASRRPPSVTNNGTAPEQAPNQPKQQLRRS